MKHTARENMRLLCLAGGILLTAVGVLWLLRCHMLEKRANEAERLAGEKLAERIGDPHVILEQERALSAMEEMDAALLSLRPMPTVTVDGAEYIGFLHVPSLDLTLPVQSTLSMEGLKTSPRRYAGSIYTDDLVIAGHNYARHFSPLRHLENGAEIDFIDVEDNVTEYVLSYTEILEPSEVEYMTEKSNGYDLTLFTCQIGGKTRYALRCLRSESE